MGQDKGLLILGEKPLLIHLLETLNKVVDEIILVLRDSNQAGAYQNIINDFKNKDENNHTTIKIVKDREKDQGPLLGILTGLSYITDEGALVLPCDSPFVTVNFVEQIFENFGKNKDGEFLALVPQWPDGSLEPLHAYYHKKCIPIIEQIISKDVRDVKSLFKYIDVIYVNVDILDPDKTSFRNLNSPQDLK